MTSLPEPDQYGNYWLAGVGGKDPAILRMYNVNDPDRPYWMVSAESGMLLDQNQKIRGFDSPKDALKAFLERRARGLL